MRRAIARVAALLASVLLANAAHAKAIAVPPVTVTSLAHRVFGPLFGTVSSSDGVDFPCGSGGGTCLSSGFSAGIAPGDTIEMRFEAPPGSWFSVTRGPYASATFSVAAEWIASSDSLAVGSNPTVTFESLTGVAPVVGYSQTSVGNGGAWFALEWSGTASGDFTFTAVTFSFTVENSPPGTVQAFPPVSSGASFSFGAGVGGPVGSPDVIVMQLVTPPACSNGLDDDGDGLVDYPADPGCADASDIDEHSPTLPCDDGADNDGDGRIDFKLPGDPNGDPGCGSPMWPRENPQCSDGIDNDGDGKIDFDGGHRGGVPDPECPNPWRDSERGAATCGVGAELVLILPLVARRRRRPGR